MLWRSPRGRMPPRALPRSRLLVPPPRSTTPGAGRRCPSSSRQPSCRSSTSSSSMWPRPAFSTTCTPRHRSWSWSSLATPSAMPRAWSPVPAWEISSVAVGCSLIGLAIFAVASFFAGVAPDSAVLVAARLAQGFGAAAMIPQVLALLTANFKPEERPRVFSLFGVTVGLGTVAGQILGGVLLQLNIFGWGWRPIFLVNVPIGIVAIVLARRLIPESRPDAADRLDPLGVVLLTAGVGASPRPSCSVKPSTGPSGRGSPLRSARSWLRPSCGGSAGSENGAAIPCSL